MTPTSQCEKNDVGHSNDSDIGTLSSRSSSNLSVEKAVDEFSGSPCMDSVLPYVRHHTDSPVKLAETPLPNVNNLSPNIQITNSASAKSTSKPLGAVGVNRDVGGPGSEVISRLKNGRNMPGIRNVSVQLGKKLRCYEHCKEYYFYDDSFGRGESFDTSFGLQKSQITKFSDGDYTPQEPIYRNGAAQPQVLFSDYIRTNEHVKNT